MDENSQPTRPITPTPEWYGATNTPSPKRRRRRWLILLSVVLLVGVGVTIFLLISRTKTTCLNADDYRSLTGATVTTEFSPVDMFYTDYVSFKNDSTDFDTVSNNGTHGKALIEKIANFYTSLPNKPMVVMVSGSYFAQDKESLADQRIAAVKSALITAGVPSDIIVVKDASNVVIDEDSSTVSDGETTISIMSDPSCRP